MKKIFFFILVLSLSANAFAQKNQLSGKNNISTASSSSIAEFQIETKQFALNITIENTSILEDLVLKPSDNYQQMYLNGNWGTIAKKISFNKDIKKQTVQFIVAYRVIKIGDFYKIYEEGVSCDKLKDFRNEKIFEDVKTKKLSAQAQFKTSSGEIIKKDLEINFDKNSSEGGDEVYATASINNEDLGLNVVSLKVETKKLFFKFLLKNEDYGISMIVDPTKETKKVSTLAGKVMPDGIYTFLCRMALPNGIQKEEAVEAFVENGEISLDNSSFNPLVFANGDYGKAIFKGKVSLVKFVNTRSTALTVFLPADYVVSGKSFTSEESEIQTEAFGNKGDEAQGWKTYVIAPGGYVKVKMKVAIFPIVLYDLNRGSTHITQVGLESKNFQVISLKWGGSFSLSRY